MTSSAHTIAPWPLWKVTFAQKCRAYHHSALCGGGGDQLSRRTADGGPAAPSLPQPPQQQRALYHCQPLAARASRELSAKNVALRGQILLHLKTKSESDAGRTLAGNWAASPSSAAQAPGSAGPASRPPREPPGHSLRCLTLLLYKTAT